MEQVKDPIGTLLSSCNYTIKDFIKDKLTCYSDSLVRTSELLSNRYERRITFDEVVSTMIAIKIERLTFQFSKNINYNDSLSDLLSYNWILNNKEEYLEMVDELNVNKFFTNDQYDVYSNCLDTDVEVRDEYNVTFNGGKY